MPGSKKSKLEIYVNPPNIEKGKGIHLVINNGSSSDTQILRVIIQIVRLEIKNSLGIIHLVRTQNFPKN